MSLSAVRNQPKDPFGYHEVSYTGKIERIDPSKLSGRRDASAEDGSVFTAQINRLADNGIFPAQAMAGKEGSLIVACYASEAEKILDVTFGVPALERSAKVYSFAEEKAKRQGGELSMAFGEAAEKYPVRANFRAAAANKYVAQNDFAPAPALAA